jgi:hypothetical protein
LDAKCSFLFVILSLYESSWRRFRFLVAFLLAATVRVFGLGRAVQLDDLAWKKALHVLRGRHESSVAQDCACPSGSRRNKSVWAGVGLTK